MQVRPLIFEWIVEKNRVSPSILTSGDHRSKWMAKFSAALVVLVGVFSPTAAFFQCEPRCYYVTLRPISGHRKWILESNWNSFTIFLDTAIIHFRFARNCERRTKSPLWQFSLNSRLFQKYLFCKVSAFKRIENRRRANESFTARLEFPRRSMKFRFERWRMLKERHIATLKTVADIPISRQPLG